MILNREEMIAFLSARKGKASLGELADELIHLMQENRSYSAVIQDMEQWPEDEDGKKVCPLCKQTCYWAKLTFKKRYVEAMRIIREVGMPLNFKEIAAHMNKKAQSLELPADLYNNTYFRYFTEARHWDLLRPTRQVRDRAEAFALTEKGEDFLDGQIPVDSFLYKLKGSDQVKRDGDADPLLVHEIVEDDPDELCDSAAHMENAKAAL